MTVKKVAPLAVVALLLFYMITERVRVRFDLARRLRNHGVGGGPPDPVQPPSLNAPAKPLAGAFNMG